MHKNSCIIITQNVQLTSSFHPTYHHLPSYGNRKHSILHFCPRCNHRGFSHHEKTGQLPCQIHRTAYHHRRSHLHLFQLLHSGIVALKHTITKPDKHLTRASWSTCRHATELSLKAIQPNRPLGYKATLLAYEAASRLLSSNCRHLFCRFSSS